MNPNQLPNGISEIFEKELENFKAGASIQLRNKIPDSSEIPISNPTHWIEVPDVICVFADMINSTGLSAKTHPKNTAAAYQLFTGTAVRVFHHFDCPYIDVKGDGVFALFNSDQAHRALVAAVTFKTFCKNTFVPKITAKTDVEIGGHVGIDENNVLVRKIGLKKAQDRTDRQNEVWAGKPVNMASKLAAIANDEQLLVSDRFFKRLTHEHALWSCRCNDSSERMSLWEEVDLSSEEKFDFNRAYLLKTHWCAEHGNTFSQKLLDADN